MAPSAAFWISASGAGSRLSLSSYCLYMPAPIGGLNCHKWQYFPFERKRSISALFAKNLQIMPRQRQSGSAGGPSRAQAPTY